MSKDALSTTGLDPHSVVERTTYVCVLSRFGRILVAQNKGIRRTHEALLSA